MTGAKRTGWRFVRHGASGTFVPDPDGTDRPPPDYFVSPDAFGERERDADRRLAAEIAEEDRPTGEQRQLFAAMVRQRVFEMFGGPPVGERIGPGRCDDCGQVVADREVFGRVRNDDGSYRPRELCLDDLRRRRAASVLTSLHTSAPSWTGWRRVGKRYVRDPQGVDRPPVRRRKPSPPATPRWRYWQKEPTERSTT